MRRSRGLPLRQLQLLRQAAAGLACTWQGVPPGAAAGSATGTLLHAAPSSQLWRYDSPLLRHLSMAPETEVRRFPKC